jgi:hypothetical protein
MSPYPFLSCRSWPALCGDLAELPSDLVSLTIVSDPFGDITGLRACVDDIRRFKGHHVADTSVPMTERVWRHHRRLARRGSRTNTVEVLERPADHLAEWLGVYANVVDRHAPGGIRAYSPVALERQLRVPGLVAFRARDGGETTGMTLWFMQGEVAYRHLVATSPAGRATAAMHALDWFASEWFTGRCAWLHFGAVPGPIDRPGSGLDAYKRGWCTHLLPNYLARTVLDRQAYDALAAATPSTGVDYFPAYRARELL